MATAAVKREYGCSGGDVDSSKNRRTDAQGVRASILRHYLKVARCRGIETATLSAMLGVDLEALSAGSDGWVPVHVCESLLEDLLAMGAGFLLGGAAAQRSFMSEFGVLSYLAQTYSTPREIFMAFCRYERLVSDVGSTCLQQQPGATRICFEVTQGSPEFRRCLCELMLGLYRRYLPGGECAPGAAPIAVHFRHAAPPPGEMLDRYEECFGGTVEFDQPQSALWVPDALMDYRLRVADPDLQGILERHARRTLGEGRRVATPPAQDGAALAAH